MKKMAAGKFKTHCLRVMEQVHATREPVLITKRGRPLAKLVPAEKTVDDFVGRLEGEIKIVGDIESPVVSWEDWDPLR
ncbi:MAG: type II toxin-antitoxin system Phd/YefM family antitoxin [Acidobacteriia bacterium]|nr:type II toxin-antitoxin system Phd/YefM family antitoxin [Terriglobia bacterium]